MRKEVFMITAVVGANWGDEGKGKITDVLAQESDYIVRFQGGSNAETAPSERRAKERGCRIS